MGVARRMCPISLPGIIGHHEGGGSMRTKIASIPWRNLIYTAATMATLALAAGAKWRPTK